MTLPKMSKYVRDGEVDPGVRDVAQQIKKTFALLNVDWTSFGYSYDMLREGAPAELVHEIETVCYFVASRGGGTFSGEPFAEYVGEARGLTVLPRFEGAVQKDGKPTAVSPYVRTWYEPAHKNADYARELYTRLLGGEQNRDLLVEALMFYDPSGDFAAELQAADKPLELAHQIAESTASAIPPLGKKWIIAGLVSRGVTVGAAKEAAFNVYDKGGNYLGWKEEEERREAVRAILVQYDPDVTDEQVDKVARSPVPLGAIETTFRALATAPPPEESSSGLLLGVGALALGLGGLWWYKTRSR